MELLCELLFSLRFAESQKYSICYLSTYLKETPGTISSTRMAIQPDPPSETSFEGFKYGTLDADKREIRLVTLEEGIWSDEIRCSLRTLSLHDQPAYEALSYV